MIINIILPITMALFLLCVIYTQFQRRDSGFIISEPVKWVPPTTLLHMVTDFRMLEIRSIPHMV
jgi:hypothetical protein